MSTPAPSATPPATSAAAAPAARDAAARHGRIVVAGVGLVTPLGHGAWPTFRALLAGATLADRADALPADVDAVGLVQALGHVAIARHAALDPALELAERAAREAIQAASGAAPPALFLATSKGAMHALTRVADRHARDRRIDDRDALAVALGPHGYLTHHVARRMNLLPQRHHVAACASSLASLHMARQHLLHQPVSAANDRAAALVVTAEAALLPAFIHSYRRLGVLAPLTREGYRQRPLHVDRAGFMLAEAGAAVLLERLAPGEAPAPGQVELVDTAIAGEAYDMVRPAPGMPALAHVARRLLADRPIDVIHPHAPGTLEHDATELRLYHDLLAGRARVAGAEVVAGVYACKGALGHSLGAGGLTAFVLACLSVTAGRLPPMGWLDAPLGREAVGFDLAAGAGAGARAGRSIERVGMHGVFAAGFAGHTAGAVVRRV
ncbi:MAG: beta-ketoacyl synthase N-terminal-like domain-containing protein [Phycisphaeraceae bacterium]